MAEPGGVGAGSARLPREAFKLVERTDRTIARHGMLEDGAKVLVAVSGGPDSTCLLDVMVRLAGPHDYLVEVTHVDHGLSPDSAAVAAAVAHGAAARGLEVHVVRAPELAGPNLHSRAREFRYAFFEAVAGGIGAAAVATGHTLDDRVETTLARLIHGAGTDGLAGLPPSGDGRIRPLIESRRTETRAYCETLGLDFVDDPANADPRFERALIRGEIMAAIHEHFGEGAVRAMATSAERLAEDASALRGLAEAAFEQAAEVGDDGVSFDADVLRGMPRAFQRRLLETAVGRVRDRSGGIDAALDALEGPAGGSAERRFAVASNIEIVFVGGRVEVSRRMTE